MMLGSISHSSYCHIHSFKTRPGPVSRVRTRPIHGWNRVRLKKNRGRKNPEWPGGLTRRPIHNPLTFVFSFYWNDVVLIFNKKKNWPGQNPKPEPLTGPDLKIIVLLTHVEVSNQIELKHGHIHNIIISQPFLSALM